MSIQDKQKLVAQKLMQKHSKKAVLHIPKRDPQMRVPLSPAQMRLWLLQQMDPNSSAYNLVSCFSLKGNLDVKALKLALDSLEKRHEMLRTAFSIDEEGVPFQNIQSAQGAPFNIEEVSLEGNDHANVDRIINARANILFNFEKGPLWNISLIKTGPNAAILVINIHHIAFDGWSLGVFVRELFDYYKEAVMTGSVITPELEIQYADYSEWQRNYLQQSERATEQAIFWREYLKNTPGVLTLRHDFPRKQNFTNKGATKTLVLSWELFHALCHVGRDKAITPFNLFMSIFKTLLYRYSGQQHIVIGTPVSGRAQPEFSSLIGILANTLPITNSIDPNEPFLEMAERIAQGSLMAFKHADLAFDSIVETVNPERIAGVNPLFQIFYAYQTKVDPGSVAGLDVLYQIRDFGTAKFDLSLDVMEGPEGPTCIFEYNTDLFMDQTIERMMVHFHQLVKNVVADPMQSVGTIEFLTEQERNRLAPPHPIRYLPDEYAITFGERFNQMVNRCGARTALVDGSIRLSYTELAYRVNRVINGLVAAGVVEAENIGVCLPRSWEMVVTVLAINHLGCAFVALDPEQPEARLQHLIENANINRIIHSEKNADKITQAEATTEFLTIELLLLAPENVSLILPRVLPHAIAYCVYTSGTTGKPKGVAITHSNWMNALYGWQKHYALGNPILNHLQMANIGFDVFCGDVIRALGTGGKLVLCKKEDFAQPDILYHLMCAEQIEFAEFVPAVFRPFADYLERSQQTLLDIKLLAVASDSWYMSEYQRFLKLLPASAKLINSYGMVECTIDSTWFSSEQLNTTEIFLNNDATVPVGFNFPNVDTYVLSEQQQLQPLGVIGEIYVGGMGVAGGYIGLDLLNKERFLQNPFVENEKMYRTGDLGYRRADGSLVLLGRSDNQVKIRGQRVELAEIEACILRSPHIAKAVINVQKNTIDQVILVAYLVVSEEFELTELKTNLSQWLPGYMIPSHYLVLAELPLNQNGKVDRKALPPVATMTETATAEFQAPATPTENVLATIWGEIFKGASISRVSDFFGLGGHSLTAVQMVAHIRKSVCENVSVQDIFNHTRLMELAARIDTLKNQSPNFTQTTSAPVVTITPKPEDRFKPFPMTPIQQAYWLGRGDLFEFGNVSAHSYDEFDMELLNPARLEAAWNKVVQQHDMLRTVVLSNGEMQVLPEVPNYRIRCEDFTGLHNDHMNQALAEVRAQMSHQIIDVTAWPTFDVRLSMLPDARMRLHFSTDAIMFDVRSFIILLEDFIGFYSDNTKQVQPAEISFRDYVLAEQDIVQSVENTKARDYWQERIPSLPPAPQIPQAKNPRDVIKPHFTRLHNRWNRDIWTALKKMAMDAGITPTGLLLAAYAETLACYSRASAFSLNLTFLNRRPLHPAVDKIVGEFTSLTLLAIDNADGQDFKSRARKIQANLWESLEHNDFSGIDVLRELSKISGDNYRARMPVVFTSALVMDVPEQIAGIDITPLHLNSITQTSQVWLDCGVWEEAGELLCNWDVVKEMYPDGVIEQMFSDFTALVGRLADSANLWSAVSLRDNNSQTETYPDYYPQIVTPHYIGNADDTLIQLFLDRLQNQPHQLAVIAEDRSLTYLQLAEIGYGLAEKFINNDGTQANLKNRLVAIVMHKGWEQVAAAVGIMMAGGAYLPVDPELPAERIQYLIAQCDVEFLVTQPWLVEEIPALGPINLIVLEANCRRELDAHLVDFLPSADDLAYVIFTSGSTGLPKGVVIDQRGATNTILDCNRRYGVTHADSVLAISALNFDLSVYDIFGMLAVGGFIVMPAYEKRLDPRHWLAQITAHKITIWNSVPALLGLLINYCEQQQIQLPSLRQAWVSGDWVPLTLSERLRAVNQDISVTSMGGATEASIWSITYPIFAIDPTWQSVPYGKAMHNQMMYVLNHRLEICPRWVIGEIYIGGIGLAKGYWRDEQKSAQAFIIHPITGARLYKTGDLGRLLPDGNIEFLGRADFQVKVQGYRIELGEIEQTLMHLDGVKDALVSVIGDRHSDKTLVAYIVAQPNFPPLDFTLIQNAMAEKLPTYMVPRRYYELSSFPLTANGKVDRNQLKIPETIAIETRPCFRAAETELQQRLVEIWQTLLKQDIIGIDDQFIHLGGDSMKAVTMLIMIQSRLGIDASFRQIMTSKSIAELAENLSTCKVLDLKEKNCRETEENL